jgi:hypothetical protein
MTKEITKASILQEIQDKFGLREFEPAKFLFDETVVPVYDIERHLTKWEIMEMTVSITSAAGFYFFKVPANERWLLRAYQVIYGMTGAHKGSGLYIDYRPPSTATAMYLDLKKGQDVSYLVNLPNPVMLSPGNRLYYLIDDYTSTQNLTIDIDVQKEEIR